MPISWFLWETYRKYFRGKGVLHRKVRILEWTIFNLNLYASNLTLLLTVNFPPIKCSLRKLKTISKHFDKYSMNGEPKYWWRSCNERVAVCWLGCVPEIESWEMIWLIKLLIDVSVNCRIYHTRSWSLKSKYPNH